MDFLRRELYDQRDQLFPARDLSHFSQYEEPHHLWDESEGGTRHVSGLELTRRGATSVS